MEQERVQSETSAVIIRDQVLHHLYTSVMTAAMLAFVILQLFKVHVPEDVFAESQTNAVTVLVLPLHIIVLEIKKIPPSIASVMEPTSVVTEPATMLTSTVARTALSFTSDLKRSYLLFQVL